MLPYWQSRLYPGRSNNHQPNNTLGYRDVIHRLHQYLSVISHPGRSNNHQPNNTLGYRDVIHRLHQYLSVISHPHIKKKLKKTCRSPSPPRRHRRRARDSEDWVETARIWGFGRSTNGGCSKSKSFSTYIFCILCFTLVHKTTMFTIFYLHHATSIHNHLEKFYISYMFLMCSFFVHLCGAKWQFAYCLPSSTG